MKLIDVKVIERIVLLGFILNFVACDEAWVEKSDLVQENINGKVCLIIEKEYKLKDGEEILINEIVTKYNRFGNMLRCSDGNVKCSYDLNGKLLVKESSKESFLFNEKRKLDTFTITTFWKYFYDTNGNLSKITEYTQDKEQLQKITFFEYDDLNYKVKETQLSNKYNYLKQESYIDTTIIIYQYDKKRKLPLLEDEFSGKRHLKRIYNYDKAGHLCWTHEKDINVYRDSSAYYDFYNVGDMTVPKGYSYEEINTNRTYMCSYDDRHNLTYVNFCDSTNNKEEDNYWKYQYDIDNNWTRCEKYDNFHRLISYKSRKIEYYPRNGVAYDYTWEDITSPMEQQYEDDRVRQQKEEAYLNDEFILEQFYTKMKEYPNYRIKGKPKIVYRNYCTYRINFDALYSWDANFYYPEKVNRTVEIVLNLDDDTYSFVPIKGDLR